MKNKKRQSEETNNGTRKEETDTVDLQDAVNLLLDSLDEPENDIRRVFVGEILRPIRLI